MFTLTINTSAGNFASISDEEVKASVALALRKVAQDVRDGKRKGAARNLDNDIVASWAWTP